MNLIIYRSLVSGIFSAGAAAYAYITQDWFMMAIAFLPAVYMIADNIEELEREVAK